jgi:hypothetical protein
MTKKTTLPQTAPRFIEGEIITGLVTVVLCGISALALAYHVYDKAPADMPELISWAFTALSGVFAFGMGLVPMLLARAHGTSMEGGSAQAGLTFVVFLFILVDMALQIHAMHYIMDLMEVGAPSLWWLVAVSAAFQIAAFMVRGSLFAASREIQELIDARAHEAELAVAYAKEAFNAKRRADYAANKTNVVGIRG